MKSASLQQFVELPQQRRHLQHGADAQPRRRRAHPRRLGQQQRAGGAELGHRGDHREHHRQLPPARRRAAARATAGAAAPAGRAPTRRLRQPIAGFSSSGGALPGSSLSPPRSSVRNSTGRPAGGVQHAGIDRGLLGDIGDGAARQHGDLGAEQADARPPRSPSSWSSSSARPTLSISVHRGAVGGHGGPVAQAPPSRACRAHARRQRALIGRPAAPARGAARTGRSSASSTRLVAGLGRLQRAARAAERRQAQRAGEDGGVAGGAGFLDHHAGDAARVPVQQLGRAQPAREQDRARRHRRRRLAAVERAQQAAGQSSRSASRSRR